MPDVRFQSLDEGDLADIWYALSGCATRHPERFKALRTQCSTSCWRVRAMASSGWSGDSERSAWQTPKRTPRRTPASADDQRGFPSEVCGPDVGSKGADTFVRAWLADGGGWVTPRVAIGAELFRPPEITAGVSRSVQILDETERETALLATLRVRTFGGRIVAVDALGGGGLLITSRQLSGRLFLPPQNESFSFSESATTSTFVGGVDITLHAARHWDFAPLVRLYRFNRDVTGSMIDHSSNHFIFGFITRATW